MITAHSAKVWQTGDFRDSIRLDTSAGLIQIPVAVRVLPARRRFSDVAAWFVPLFAACLLPALTLAYLSHFADVRYLIPAAAVGSGLLTTMLLAVASAADMGIEERIACGVVTAVMAVVLGVSLGVAHRAGSYGVMVTSLSTGVPIGALLFCQLLSRRHWQFWAGAIAVLSILASGTFLSALSR